MKIVTQTTSELSLCNQRSWAQNGFVGVWALFFAGIPLAIMVGWIYGLGVTHLSCQRLEPSAPVTCDRNQSHLLGLKAGPTTTFTQVTAAELKTETMAAGNIRTVDSSVVLHTSRGAATYIEDPIRINGRRGSVEEMQAITTQLNQFLASDQGTLTIQRDMRFRLGQSIFPLVFLSLFVIIGGTVIYFAYRSEVLIFDKTSCQFRCIRQTLLGDTTWERPLDEIRDVAIDMHTDTNGHVTYALKLMPTKGRQEFIPCPKRQLEISLDTIREFLQLGIEDDSQLLTTR